VNIIQGALDPFTETGGGSYALSFASQSLSEVNGVLGLHGDGFYPTRSGIFSPHFRLEFQHDFEGAGQASLAYADWIGGPNYVATLDPTKRDHLLAGFGLNMKIDQAIFGFDYRADFSAGEQQEHEVTAKMQVKF